MINRDKINQDKINRDVREIKTLLYIFMWAFVTIMLTIAGCLYQTIQH